MRTPEPAPLEQKEHCSPMQPFYRKSALPDSRDALGLLASNFEAVVLVFDGECGAAAQADIAD
jgi:hypothetical protein